MTTTADIAPRPDRRHRRRRGAALYATTLLICVAVTGAGLGLVTLQMAHRRLQRNVQLAGRSALLVQSGMDWIFWGLENDPAWRTNWNAGQSYDLSGLGMGSLSATLDDPDGNLKDDSSDPVVVSVTGTITQGTATSSRRMRVSAVSAPHPILQNALCSRNDIDFSSAVYIDGPVRAEGDITDDGTAQLSTNASFETRVGGTISANLSPARYATAAADVPVPDLTFYKNQATRVAKTGGVGFEFFTVNLTPTSSSVGLANPKGVYWIDAGNNNVFLRYVHVKGTLIISNAGDVRIDKACCFEPGGFGYPVLLVDIGIKKFEFDVLSGDQLNESSANLDYNGDGDRTDTFPPSVTGLAWIDAASVLLAATSWNFTGCLIATNDVTVNQSVRLRADASMFAAPPPGFEAKGMRFVRGTAQDAPLEK